MHSMFQLMIDNKWEKPGGPQFSAPLSVTCAMTQIALQQMAELQIKGILQH